MAAVAELCERFDIDLDELRTASGFAFIALRDAAVEALLVDEEVRAAFLAAAHRARTLFKRCCPTQPPRYASPPWPSSGCSPNGSWTWPGHRTPTSVG